MIRRVPAKHRNARIAREKDTEAFLRLGLLLVVGLGLACGFVYAGRQHFTALRYGYETETLRRERDQLSEQQRRLILQREEAASPLKLEQAAKRLGMQPLQAAQIDPLRQTATNAKDNATIKAKANAAKPNVKPNTKPNTKIITKVPGQTPAKPSHKKPT
jgi:cell division protein FtsL